MTYDGFPFPHTSYQSFDSTGSSPIVEFTDLTAPYQEDRRRRRSHPIKDKQTISTMHMVRCSLAVGVDLCTDSGQRRRAQNRASQRAFRERKEKHAQDLQCQLDELEAKHKALLASYQKLDTTNAKLTQELDQLRAKITDVHSSRTDAYNELAASDGYDPFEFEHDLEADAVSSTVK